MIVGIIGNAGHGKDTMADYLITKLGGRKLAFAGKLKQCLSVLFEFTEEQLYGDKKETIDEFWQKTPRQCAQIVGTDLFRQWDPNFWLKCMQRQIKNTQGNIFISDVRFKNEAEFVLKNGGHLVKIIRPNFGGITNHISETELHDIDAPEIINNGTLLDFYKKIDEFIMNI